MEVELKGYVSRALPQGAPDTTESQVRSGRYDELYVQPLVRKQHLLADEGTYFTTNNGQTGIASSVGTAFSATAGFINIYNTDTEGQTAKRLYLDYITLVTTAAGSFASAGVNLQIVMTLDTADRYSSGGTDISANIVNVNMHAPIRSSIAKVRCGALTLTAATGSARTVCGLRILRPVVSATVADVVGETKTLNFGGVEMAYNGSITVANANQITMPMPPVIIGPQQSINIHFLMNGTTPAAASYAPEICWFER